jgi:hypothetical protein
MNADFGAAVTPLTNGFRRTGKSDGSASYTLARSRNDTLYISTQAKVADFVM